MNNPPSSNKAEMALIGSIINDYTILTDLKVKTEDFYYLQNQELFDACIKLKERLNIITLQDVLGKSYDMTYANDCTNLAYTTQNYNHFEEIIISKSVLRKQIILAQQIISNSMSGNDSSDLFRQSQDFDNYFDDEMVMIKDLVGEALDNIEAYQQGKITQGIMTNIKGLDKLLNGLVDGDLIYIGARPSMGKTALAMQMGLNIAEQGKKVGIFSLEMQNAKLVKRMLVNQARVHLGMIQDRKLGEKEMKRLTDASAKLFRQNISISDKAGQSAMDILRKAKRHQKIHGLDILIIDHFHLLKPSITGTNYEKRSFDSQLIKEIAKELNIPVICLCQLSRALETRPIGDRMPILSDLKETGSLEQDGDVIIFLNRDDYWHKNNPDWVPTHDADISIAKQRDGETGKFRMQWHGATQRFDD